MRSSECVEEHGHNVTAALKSDGTVMVIAVSGFNDFFMCINVKLG